MWLDISLATYIQLQAFNNHSKMLDNVIEKLIIVNNTKYPDDVIRILVRWCPFAFSWTFFNRRLHCANFWDEHHLVFSKLVLKSFFLIFKFLVNWLHFCSVFDTRHHTGSVWSHTWMVTRVIRRVWSNFHSDRWSGTGPLNKNVFFLTQNF